MITRESTHAPPRRVDITRPWPARFIDQFMEVPIRQRRWSLRMAAQCCCVACGKLAHAPRSLSRCLKHLRTARLAAERYKRQHQAQLLAYNAARRGEYARLRALGKSALEARQGSRSLAMRRLPR